MSVPSSPSVRQNSGFSGHTTHQDLTEIERQILASLQQIRFGSLEIIIHDSRVVQIERSEKLRFDAKGKPLNESLS
ncbi:YezD family protein [Asticcacaulis sp. 201]|uniref:YezD family protein n=1 Tax=Asticcacaulis sp. 201 TaxID=3028787 RepID=UPI002916B8FD|nr:YezD family protein [Asticcacaulis sp. 201]MDV6332833.1 YezD family protein [Asticcacaulis sp. 201]